MKILKLHLFFIALFAIALTLSSCGHKHDENHKHDSDKTEKSIDKNSKEYASAYICPMHCEGSGADEAGKCPVCGMDYVKNPDYHTDSDNANNEEADADLEHVEDHDHEGHDHDGHTH